MHRSVLSRPRGTLVPEATKRRQFRLQGPFQLDAAEWIVLLGKVVPIPHDVLLRRPNKMSVCLIVHKNYARATKRPTGVYEQSIC
ncbi:hypothetical protein D3C72_2125870 [compost metagenome]